MAAPFDPTSTGQPDGRTQFINQQMSAQDQPLHQFSQTYVTGRFKGKTPYAARAELSSMFDRGERPGAGSGAGGGLRTGTLSPSVKAGANVGGGSTVAGNNGNISTEEATRRALNPGIPMRGAQLGSQGTRSVSLSPSRPAAPSMAAATTSIPLDAALKGSEALSSSPAPNLAMMRSTNGGVPTDYLATSHPTAERMPATAPKPSGTEVNAAQLAKMGYDPKRTPGLLPEQNEPGMKPTWVTPDVLAGIGHDPNRTPGLLAGQADIRPPTPSPLNPATAVASEPEKKKTATRLALAP